ncbi:molecular chaperone [Sphingopyxis sp. PAMC25046]|uniref:fimbrial biogenesis chaperone n=1 Tax=Sphingopyxis sp. PAMC25046 TaxID=2565556 RepID=UPI00109DDBFC|nr:molecular chaperone [Sphingopyxis sp. PAMC25046]QCB56671.1 molecular chaperone [Sphingopyxis sp. PAMC25046]
MFRFLKAFGLLTAAAFSAAAVPVHAAGDLLVAPTRVILDGSRGTEVVLNNIGSEPATYRISLEIKRMTAAGGLDEIAEENVTPAERAALDMIVFSPRRVTLPPNQPQVVRVGVRVPEGTPPGEYRAHMLFRAVPDAAAANATEAKPASTGVSIALTPIYGITIPVIVRVGDLGAEAAIGDAWVSEGTDGPAFNFDLSRSGNRSVYGDIEVTRPGVAEPLLVARGIAVYPEVAARTVSLRVPDEVAAKLKGPVRIRYSEDREIGGGTIDEAERVVK